VAVDHCGRIEPAEVAWWGRVAGEALGPVPPVVATARFRRPLDVDLFPRVLADVGDVQVSSQPIEAEAPRVAQAEGPDLRQGVVDVDERVVVRNPVAGLRRDVESQELAEQGQSVLAAAQGIACTATVAGGHPQHVIGAERQVTAVVIGKRLGDGEQHYLGGRIHRAGGR